MAEVVTGLKRAAGGIVLPRASESRVVTMGLTWPKPVEHRYLLTPILPESLVLLGIRFWLWAKPSDPTDDWWFDLKRGFTRAESVTELHTWERFLEIFARTGIHIWNGYGTPVAMEWSMEQRLIGPGQRFGAVVNVVGPTTAYFQMSFEFSEG